MVNSVRCVLICVHIHAGCIRRSKDSPTAYSTVHRTVEYPGCAGVGLSSPIHSIKNTLRNAEGIFLWGG